MNTLHVFLALIWVTLVLAVLIVGWVVTQRFAEDADSNNLPVWKALGGTALRGVGTIVLLALIIGLPLDLLQF